MTTSDSREGGTPEPKTKRRSRRLSGPGRQALFDLYLILLILASDLDPEVGGALRVNINRWRDMYLGPL